MVADLILIGLGIALQPFRVSAFILILSTKGGTRKGLGFILGWLACLVLVIAVVLLVTGGRPFRRHSSIAATISAIPSAGDYLALASFCLLATSSFIALELYAVVSSTASARLAALRTWLDEHGGQVIIVLCLAIGLWLAGQSIHLLTETGRGAVEHCGGRPAC